MRRTNVDANGHPIMGYFEMIDYYQGDKKSLDVIRSFPPGQYQVLPEITIRIIPSKLPEIYIIHVYPLQTFVFSRKITAMALDALRRLFRAPRAEWKPKKEPFTIILKRPGAVIKYRRQARLTGDHGQGG